jgi:integrase
MAGIAQNIFLMLDRGDSTLTKLSNKEIQALADKWLLEARAAFEEAYFNNAPALADKAEFSRSLAFQAQAEADALQRGDFPYMAASSDIDQILASNGHTDLPPDSSDYKRLCVALTKAQMTFTAELQGFLQRGEHPLITPAPSSPAPTVPAPVVVASEAPNSPLLSECKDDFIRYNAEYKNTGTETRRDYRLVLTEFLEVVGDIPINKLTDEDIGKYRKFILNCPERRTLKPKYRDRPIKWFLTNETPQEDRMAERTIDKRVTQLATFLKRAEKKYNLNLDYTSMLRMPPPKKRADEGRQPFTPAELNAIFNISEYCKDEHVSPSYFWLPVLGAYTGARLEELGQLHLSDIRQDEESAIWYFDINEDTDDKSVKSNAGRRVVPLHPVIIETGFLNYVSRLQKRGEELLFPELSPGTSRKQRTACFSKWFSRRIHRIDNSLGTNSGKTFHSLRHTFISNLIRLVRGTPDQTLLEELDGHAKEGSETVTRYGGHRASVKELYNAIILRLDYPGLDISHLQLSRHATPDGGSRLTDAPAPRYRRKRRSIERGYHQGQVEATQKRKKARATP